MHHAETTTSTQPQELDWQQLLETALSTPGSVGNVYNRFYEYSFLNQTFLRLQGVTEPVATYKRWQALGRQVLRGSRAHAIIRPMLARVPAPEGQHEPDDEAEPRQRLLGFKLVRCLFTVSQTEGEPLPPVELPRWDLATALDRLTIRQVPFDLLDGNTQGYSVGRDYAINPVAADPARTTFHELGHIVLGHTEAAPDVEQQHRGEGEFQAEATAYLCLNELERLTEEAASHSRGYIQHWLRGQRPSDAAIRAVFAATDAILKAGRVTATAPNIVNFTVPNLGQ